MLACINPRDLLLIDSFCVTNRIIDFDQANHLKFQLIPIRCFDYETLPFVVSTGLTSINLINVKSATMQPLVKTKTECKTGQSVAFFKAEETGISFHYTTQRKDALNEVWNSWFSTTLHLDFIECIKTLGRLPPTKTEDLIEDLKALKDKEEVIEAKNKVIEDQAQALKDEKARNEQLKN